MGTSTASKTATATKTSTSTSTVANPKGNITVTGGAGDGDTIVNVHPKDDQKAPGANAALQGLKNAKVAPATNGDI